MVKSALLTTCASLVALLSSHSAVSADPYEFTPNDYIEYGIYFSPGGSHNSTKLLTLRFGNIEGYYDEYFPQYTPPTRRQSLKLATKRGSVRVNRNDNDGVTVIRDTFNEKKRIGTKRLEVFFAHGLCTDSAGTQSPCAVNLTLTADTQDQGVKYSPRTLVITTSTGLSFRYRSPRRDGGQPINFARLRRMPSINNYAWEWRPGR